MDSSVGDTTTSQDTIIEGLAKFRDGKKWKSRWCIMRKLSPVADCIHLQVYRDGKDRQKGSLPKASLALRDFMGCESGFTLDKESHTLALLCRGEPAALLALGGPEEMLRWRARALRALSGPGAPCTRWPALLLTPGPGAAKAGPVAVHVRPTKFCLVSGMPPRIAAIWEIADLRRYGVIDGKVCFEGGSRCGKFSGPWVLQTERPHALVAALDAAAPPATKHNEELLKLHKRFSDITESTKNIFDSKSSDNIEFSPGWNLYDGQFDSASSVGYNDSASVTELKFVSNEKDRGVNRHASFGKCVSCMSHLSGLSSTTPTGNVSILSSWNDNSTSIGEPKSEADRASLYSQSSGGTSDYSVPRGIYTINEPSINKSQLVYGGVPNLWPKNVCPCKHSKKSIGPYQNYDVPKPPLPLIQEYPNETRLKAETLYDKPKNFIKCLLNNSKSCDCLQKSSTSVRKTLSKPESLEKIIIGNISTSQEVPISIIAQTNYANVEPPKENVSPLLISQNPEFISDFLSLEKFESSAEILRNAGFSQDEIDELEDLPSQDLSENQKNVDKKNQNVCLTSNDNSTSVTFSTCTSEISDCFSCVENTSLNRRKSSSADFLKKAEEFFDISKSNSHKDILIELNPLRKKLNYECVNDNCLRCTKKQIDPVEMKNDFIKINSENMKPLNKIKESVKIRRSSSVPNKCLKNRDSSSSNDSGVSTGSFKHCKCDFSYFETPVNNNSTKHTSSIIQNRKTMNSSPVSTTSDTMQHITFQFEKPYGLPKSHSCDTGAIQCHKRNTRDLRSPSSCGSELSDYLETLSMCSISSNEVSNRSVARPRSGREYSSLFPAQSALRTRNTCQCCSQTQYV